MTIRIFLALVFAIGLRRTMAIWRRYALLRTEPSSYAVPDNVLLSWARTDLGVY